MLRPMNAFQYDMTDTHDERQKKLAAHESQLFLPVDPLQKKLEDEEAVLTDRELEIMQMVLTGKSIEEIAMTIFLSAAGVKWRLSSVYSKFGVPNRMKLIEKCSTTGLQFRTSSGVQHTFHNKLNLRAHDEK